MNADRQIHGPNDCVLKIWGECINGSARNRLPKVKSFKYLKSGALPAHLR